MIDRNALFQKYEKEFNFRKKIITKNLDVYHTGDDKEMAYDTGFINGMRFMLKQLGEIDIEYLTVNETLNIIEENKKELK